MNLLRTVSLIYATMATGLAAGTYLLYAHTVMPGLGTTDDRTFVTSFAAMDRAIINPVFMITAFFGPLIALVVAALAFRGTPANGWVLLGLGLYVAVVILTVSVNVPLNDALKQAVGSGRFDAGQVRAAFHAGRWQVTNLVRVLLCGGAFLSLCWALVLYGRSE